MTNLPTNVFEGALTSFHQVQTQRLRRLHNRTRTVFARFVVAQLIGATVEFDPGTAGCQTAASGTGTS